MPRQTYLVTGGAGFIGSALVRRLLEQGSTVRVLDNMSSGTNANLAEVASKIELVEGDIRDLATVRKVMPGVDVILHQAALASVPRSIDDPLASNAVNIDGTLNLMWTAVECKVKKFVMASSSSVYGETEELPKHEKMMTQPLSPYAITKLVGEYYCDVFWKLYKLPTVALRYFNIFGPRQDPKGDYAPVIPIFITKLLKNEAPTIYGDGEQSRDFTFVDNAVDANLLAATNDKMNGGVFNVGCGAQYTLNQLVDKLNVILGTTLKPQYFPARVGDIKHSYAAIKHLESFGYKPTVNFDDGLQKTVNFFKNQ